MLDVQNCNYQKGNLARILGLIFLFPMKVSRGSLMTTSSHGFGIPYILKGSISRCIMLPSTLLSQLAIVDSVVGDL